MNSAAPTAVRLACRVARICCALGAGPASSAHVAGCPDCQRHFRAVAALDLGLRRAAPAARPAPAGDFEARLLSSVRAARAPASARAAAGERAWFGAATAAAFAVTLALAVYVGRPAAVPAPRITPAETVAMAAAAQEFSSRMVGAVVPRAAAAVAENPLQQEIGALTSDLRSAVDFLALNFLPQAE